tara:strand:- start:366 stop:1379 length:1014 start_codon:yes stop_codon:yes gene_type:complete
MINRYILKIIFLSFVKAQIALPTFQAVHKPQSSSSSSSLYNFTSHTFTNCGATSTSGPTLANCKSSYDTSWEDNTNYFNVQTQGIQEWTVPKTGTYTIEVWGAAGGGNQYRTIGGRGARMRGTFSLNQEDKLKILVGQKGPNTSDQYNAGGGGGSFVILGADSILVIAGGGGGSGYHSTTNYFSSTYADASTSTTGQYGFRGSNQTTVSGQAVSGNGGGCQDKSGGGGGGYSGNGASSTKTGNYNRTGKGGYSFTNGGIGGSATTPLNNDMSGGFGGGGSGDWDNWTGGGGGGGYSGGGGGYWYGNGGGGSSYNSGSDQSNSTGAREDHGQIIITIN